VKEEITRTRTTIGFTEAEMRYLHDILNNSLSEYRDRRYTLIKSGIFTKTSTTSKFRLKYSASYDCKLRQRIMDKADRMMEQLLLFHRALIEDGRGDSEDRRIASLESSYIYNDLRKKFCLLCNSRFEQLHNQSKEK